jgi:hypothetical protein
LRYKPQVYFTDQLPVTPSQAGEVVHMSRVIAFIVVALLIFFIVTQPETAADAVQTIAAALVDFFDAILTFFGELV